MLRKSGVRYGAEGAGGATYAGGPPRSARSSSNGVMCCDLMSYSVLCSILCRFVHTDV